MKNSTTFSFQTFQKVPVVGIIRGLSSPEIRDVAEVYQETGFYALEITMNTPDVMELISETKVKFPQLCVGAGTVCSMEDFSKAVKAGAEFIVTPIVDVSVIKEAKKQGIPIFVGAFTPTEIYQAWDAGASAVKVFPATQMGPRYIKDILGPLNEIKLLPTGGVSIENINQFMSAGAFGVGMGGALFKQDLIKKKDKIGLKQHFLKLKNTL